MFRKKSVYSPPKPRLSVVEDLHPHQNRPITSLGDRLNEVITEYAESERVAGRQVTFAEIVGTIEFLKNKYLNGG